MAPFEALVAPGEGGGRGGRGIPIEPPPEPQTHPTLPSGGGGSGGPTVTQPNTPSGGSLNPQTPTSTDPLTTLADLYAGMMGGSGSQTPQYLVNPVGGDQPAAGAGISGGLIVGVLVLAVVAFVAYRFWKKHHKGAKA